MKLSASNFILLASATSSVVAVPTTNQAHGPSLFPRGVTQGYKDGYFYSFYADTPGVANFTNEEGGRYTVDWGDTYGLLGAGKGWNPGSNDRVVKYNGTYQPNGNILVGVYGWTRSPLVEYYIMGYSTYSPSAVAVVKGKINCNGADYTVGVAMRSNQPSIDGTQSFQQFWSTRSIRKQIGGAIGGEIDIGSHYEGWKKFGMDIGSEHNYQLLALQASYSNGHFSVTVS